MNKETFDKKPLTDTPSLANVKAGDKVAVLKRNNSVGPDEPSYTPYALARVSKATAKTIETGFHKYNRQGMPANKYTYGYILSVDPQIIATLQAERDKEKAERETRERTVEERINRPTYKLACQIVNSAEPDKSIADLELLGEERLETMIDEIEHAKLGRDGQP